MANALANLFTDIANSIRSKTGSTEKLSPSEFASQIDSISVGGGGAEGCVTVTFMNGANVLLTRPVYIGDDCPDPVTQGRIETPTKESTVQYHYTYKGWSEALTDITEDKVIYATYTETVRTYTVTFYDEDGTTVLNTQQVAYGTIPSYTPNKNNYTFKGWTPSLETVTGNASYTANWEVALTLNEHSWQQLGEMTLEEAQQKFSLGDMKQCEVMFPGNTSTSTLKAYLVGFNTDTLESGSKAKMTFIAVGAKYGTWGSDKKYSNCGYVTDILANFDSVQTDLTFVNAVKPVVKSVVNSDSTTEDIYAKWWLPSVTEMGFTHSSAPEENSTYPLFEEKLWADFASMGKFQSGALRTKPIGDDSQHYQMYNGATAELISVTTRKYFMLGFCI